MWSGIVKYRMPFTISGVDLMVGPPTPRCGPTLVMRYIHSIFSRVDIGLVDLVQVAEAPAGVVAVVSRPDVRRVVEESQSLRVEALRARARRAADRKSCEAN